MNKSKTDKYIVYNEDTMEVIATFDDDYEAEVFAESDADYDVCGNSPFIADFLKHLIW